MMGVVKNIMAAWPIMYAMIASNSSHCHPANGILYTNILPSRGICPSLCKCGFVTRKIMSEIECVIHHRLCSATPLDWVAIMKFKTTKVDSEGFLWLSTKISTSEITHYTVLVTIWGVALLLYLFEYRSCTPVSGHPRIVAAHGALRKKWVSLCTEIL